jgi:hypothetical protein
MFGLTPDNIMLLVISRFALEMLASDGRVISPPAGPKALMAACTPSLSLSSMGAIGMGSGVFMLSIML